MARRNSWSQLKTATSVAETSERPKLKKRDASKRAALKTFIKLHPEAKPGLKWAAARRESDKERTARLETALDAFIHEQQRRGCSYDEVIAVMRRRVEKKAGRPRTDRTATADDLRLIWVQVEACKVILQKQGKRGHAVSVIAICRELAQSFRRKAEELRCLYDRAKKVHEDGWAALDWDEALNRELRAHGIERPQKSLMPWIAGRNSSK